MAATTVPDIRIRRCNEHEARDDGDYVLYWMIASRRRLANFALQRAVELASQLERPLLVFEPLRCGYRWASDRMHAFVLQGMADNAADFDDAGVGYFPYVEREAGEGSGLLAALAQRAACIVTDDYPCFFLPRMVAAAAAAVDVQLEAVDSNGVMPIAFADKSYARAYDYRRYLQRELSEHLGSFPAGDPLAGYDQGTVAVPRDVARRWPAASEELLAADEAALAELPIDHSVGVVDTTGGARAAGRTLRTFLESGLDRYASDRSHPDKDCSSRLSPYLHFGHLSAHQVFAAIASREDWSSDSMQTEVKGNRGWLGMGENAEAFLDQLLVWRELGFNFCLHSDDHESYDSLPEWARKSLAKHDGDAREYVYSLAEFAESRTHDEIWNAAQNELRTTGYLQNYMRMLWAKKVLEWTPSPQHAYDILVELNNRYALDGRDPNSYSGIGWSLGRFDRPWAPEREVFGQIRFMSSANTKRKLRIKEYMERWG